VENDWITEFRKNANAVIFDFQKIEAKIVRFAGQYVQLIGEIKKIVSGTPIHVADGQTAVNFMGVDGKPRQIPVPFVQMNLMQRSLSIFPQIMDINGVLTCGVSFGVQRPIKALPTGLLLYQETGENSPDWVIYYPQANNTPSLGKLDGPTLVRILQEALLPEKPK